MTIKLMDDDYNVGEPIGHWSVLFIAEEVKTFVLEILYLQEVV